MCSQHAQASLTLVLAYDRGQRTYLTPGTFVAPMPLSDYDLSLLYPKSNATGANVISIHIGGSLVIVPPPQALLFSESSYKGDVTEEYTAWKSAYFSEGFYGLFEPGKAVWGAVPDARQLRGGHTSLLRVGLGSSPLRSLWPGLTNSEMRSTLCIGRNMQARQRQSCLRM